MNQTEIYFAVPIDKLGSFLFHVALLGVLAVIALVGFLILFVCLDREDEKAKERETDNSSTLNSYFTPPRMIFLVKNVTHTRPVRVHQANANCAPICGGGKNGKASIAWQEDIGPANCKRCKQITQQKEQKQMIALNEMTGREQSLGGIETLCKEYDTESAKLEGMISDLESDLDAVKQKHLAALKRQAAVVARREAELNAAVESGSGLFKKPRTLTMHGIKVGLTSSVGKLVFGDADTVVKLIKKFRKDDAALFIHTTEEPNKDAIKTLPPSEQLQIGCRIEGAGDVVIVKRVAGEIEKLVNKLIEKFVEAMAEG